MLRALFNLQRHSFTFINQLRLSRHDRFAAAITDVSGEASTNDTAKVGAWLQMAQFCVALTVTHIIRDC